jgi:hypothetical protein
LIVNHLGLGSSTIPCSDSGTSLKHHLTSSNPSSFSFDKIQTVGDIKNTIDRKSEALSVIPKVIINTKQQTGRIEPEKIKKERKKVTLNPPAKVCDNPLRALSQLLQEFENVQTTKLKTVTEPPKCNKKQEVSFEGRNTPRPGSLKRRSRLDQPAKDEHQTEKNVRIFVPRDRKVRPIVTLEPPKISRQASTENKHIDRMTRKKLADIIDEVKEAKGEAVRGPSKFNSRLNTLAQPKKSYVQAHKEEYQSKYGRNLMADRLQRLVSAPVASQSHEKASSAGPKGRLRRNSTDTTSMVSVKQPPLGV